MIPHIESTRWNTLEEGGTISQGDEKEQEAALEDLLLEYAWAIRRFTGNFKNIMAISLCSLKSSSGHYVSPVEKIVWLTESAAAGDI